MKVDGHPIFLRRATNPGREPQPSDFEGNSLCINLTDKILYYDGGFCVAEALPEWLWEILSEMPDDRTI